LLIRHSKYSVKNTLLQAAFWRFCPLGANCHKSQWNVKNLRIYKKPTFL